MTIQKNLKNLFDDYIKEFPKNNLSEPKYVQSWLGNKIVTDYLIDGVKIQIVISYGLTTNEYEILQSVDDLRSVSAAVLIKKGSDDAEKMVKKLYGELAITKSEVKEIKKEIEEEKKQEKEAEKEEANKEAEEKVESENKE